MLHLAWHTLAAFSTALTHVVSAIVLCLLSVVTNSAEAEAAYRLLKALSGVSRFDMVCMFLSDGEKKGTCGLGNLGEVPGVLGGGEGEARRGETRRETRRTAAGRILLVMFRGS